MIKKEDLITGRKYQCLARNFTIGTWDGKEFEYLRYKWGDRFKDTEQHWDDGYPHGTCKPLELIDWIK